MAHKDWDTLGKRVKGRRLLLKMNQEQLAAAAGIGQGDVSKMERGEIQQTTRIAQIARALQCDAYWLATGDGDPETGTPQPAQPSSANLPPDLLQVLTDLEDIHPERRSALIEHIRQVAQDARDAAAHLVARATKRERSARGTHEDDRDLTKLAARTADEEARTERVLRESHERTQNGGGVNQDSPNGKPHGNPE